MRFAMISIAVNLVLNLAFILPLKHMGPPLATATRTRQGKGTQGRRRRFIVEFTGEKLADAALVASTRATITAQPGAVQGVRLWPYPERKMMRVGFEVDPGTDTLSELRLVLQSGGQPVSETWLNRWTW